MRYECVHCGAGGASGKPRHKSPPTYHCHNPKCGKENALYPVEVVAMLNSERRKTVEVLEALAAEYARGGLELSYTGFAVSQHLEATANKYRRKEVH